MANTETSKAATGSKGKTILASALSLGMIASAGAVAVAGQPVAAAADASDLPQEVEGVHQAPNGYQYETTIVDQSNESDFVHVSDVQGEFAFNQEGVSPSDEMFNVFGTAILSMCSKPADELAVEQDGEANYYINIGGHVQSNFTVDLKSLSSSEKQQLMVCSCATGSPFGQTEVKGVPLRSVAEMSGMLEGVNSVNVIGADGYSESIPLQYAFNRDALLVYAVNGEDLQSRQGSSVQLWMPQTAAKYFTRNIATIEFSTDEAPEPDGVDPMYRNKIKMLNDASGCEFKVGDDITFEGVADDLGSPIRAIEFSFDGGKTWTTCETDGATADKWVNWQFTTSFDAVGEYSMEARAVTADGVVSPLSAEMSFAVTE